MDRKWDKSKPPKGAFALNRDSMQAVDLVSWWPGGPGDNLAFDMLNVGDLTSTGNDSTLSGHGAEAQELLGTNYLTTPYVAAHTPSALTAMASIRVGSLTPTYSTLISKNDGFGQYFEFHLKSNGKMAIYVANAGNSASYDGTGAFTLALGGEYQIGMSCGTSGESNSTTGYVDGVQDATTTGVASVASGVTSFNFGGSAATGGRVFTGQMFDMRFYSATRAAAFFAECADPGKRYELWYPLRSKKWFTAPAAAAITGPLVGSRRLASNGPLVSGRLAA